MHTLTASPLDVEFPPTIFACMIIDIKFLSSIVIQVMPRAIKLLY
jgi:hypothetical protein